MIYFVNFPNDPDRTAIFRIKLIMFILSAQLLSVKCSAPTNLLVTRAGPCFSMDNETMVTVSEMSVFTRVYDSSVSGRFNITQDISDGWDVKVTMQKCQDIRNLDTCDYFRSYQLIKDGCKSSADEVQAEMYNMFFRHTQPRLSCPIKAGIYKIDTYPFQTEDNYLTVSESKISTSVFGYTFRLEGFLKRRKIMCVEAFMQLLYIGEQVAGTPAPPPPAAADDDSAELY